jgi:carbon catabolite-derepressing protein kinase
MAHRDIKPDNILIDEKFNIKISDFGYAGPLAGKYDTGYMQTTLGTRPYQAPEINEKKPYKGTEVDTFAAGVVLFIMVLGTFPFTETVKSEYYYRFIYAKQW